MQPKKTIFDLFLSLIYVVLAYEHVEAIPHATAILTYGKRERVSFPKTHVMWQPITDNTKSDNGSRVMLA